MKIPKGMTIAKSISCAIKLRAGKKCSMSETAAALDTMVWAYQNGIRPRSPKKDFKRGKKYVRRNK